MMNRRTLLKALVGLPMVVQAASSIPQWMEMRFCRSDWGPYKPLDFMLGVVKKIEDRGYEAYQYEGQKVFSVYNANGNITQALSCFVRERRG